MRPNSRTAGALGVLGAMLLSASCAQTTRPTQPLDSIDLTIGREPIGSTRIDSPPDDALGRMTFPVQVGNRWRYRDHRVVRRILHGVELPPLTSERVYEEVILSSGETPYGTFFDLRDPQGAYFETPLYWQKDSGLYLRLSPFMASSARDPELDPTLFGYFTVLSYPLHVGARWRGDFGKEWVVEGVEVLDLPLGRAVAFRAATGTGTNWARQWYGPCGRLRSEWFDVVPEVENSQVVGTTTFHRVEVLESVELLDCKRCNLSR